MATVRMKDIAERAQVSIMSVSLALRNQPGVSPGTKERILAIARELGYQPNPYISALMAHIREGADSLTPPVIAYLDIGSRRVPPAIPAEGSRYAGMFSQCKKLGFRLEGFPCADPDVSFKRISEILYSRGIRGVILGSLREPGMIEGLNWGQFCFVTMGYSLQSPRLHRVVNHQVHSMQLALKSLSELGYRQIGLMLEPTADEQVDFNWSAGWMAFHRRNGMSPSVPILTLDGNRVLDSKKVRRWIDTYDLDCVLGSSVQTRKLIEKAGFSIPDEIGFAACFRQSNILDVSGVDPRHDLIGCEAVNLIAMQLYQNELGIPEVPKTIILEGVWRNSKSSPGPLSARPLQH